ncbi:MAG: hypothetical protein FJ098_14785, partial [Deltaproteobacteria bacterium]|nr:hypothetical protein [Deltaproteobacteria bacterium]
ILEGATLQTMLYLPGERRLRLWLRPAGHQGPGAWEDAAELDLVTLLGGSP